jgi:predicted small metal-binding protein
MLNLFKKKPQKQITETEPTDYYLLKAFATRQITFIKNRVEPVATHEYAPLLCSTHILIFDKNYKIFQTYQYSDADKKYIRRVVRFQNDNPYNQNFDISTEVIDIILSKYEETIAWDIADIDCRLRHNMSYFDYLHRKQELAQLEQSNIAHAREHHKILTQVRDAARMRVKQQIH